MHKVRDRPPLLKHSSKQKCFHELLLRSPRAHATNIPKCIQLARPPEEEAAPDPAIAARAERAIERVTIRSGREGDAGGARGRGAARAGAASA